MQAKAPANVLDFLQDWIDQGLALGTIKVQIAALSVYLEKSSQEDPLISRFCKAIAKCTPVRFKGTRPLLGTYR